MSIGNFGADAERIREEETSARSFSTRSFSSSDLSASENSKQSTSSISSERSVVAGRFMNMLHAHDDARALFLSAHQPRTR